MVISDQVRKLTATMKSIRKLSSVAASTAQRLSFLKSKEEETVEEEEEVRNGSVGGGRGGGGGEGGGVGSERW